MDTTSVLFWIIIVAVGLAAGYVFIRQRMLHWGATADEAGRSMPGDDLIPDPSFTTTRAIMINAGVEKVWPWLAQMGQGRGGFYSYTWLENLVGMDIHNVDRIVPELQEIKVGDLIPFWQGAGVNVVEFIPRELLVLAGTMFGSPDKSADLPPGGTWIFRLEEPTANTTRLIVRSRIAKFEPQLLCLVMYRVFLEPMHFIMEKGMLYGIKKRSEKLAEIK
jgi:hypothetical protein